MVRYHEGAVLVFFEVNAGGTTEGIVGLVVGAGEWGSVVAAEESFNFRGKCGVQVLFGHYFSG